jgi:DNA polymerase V
VLGNGLGDVATAHALRAAVMRSVGLPTRIGLGPTRALSKVANALAKASEKVWGIGPALAARLRPFGIRTAADLTAMPPAVARDVGTVVLERLVRELNGIECTAFTPEAAPLKGTAVTRCFGEPVTDSEMLREAMVRRAVRAVEKIRAQGLLASRLIAFAHGSKFKPNAPSASRSARLSPATDDPRIVAQIAGQMADAMFVNGAVYTKCGVMLEGLHAQSAAQPDLFAALGPRAGELLFALDGLNQRFGRGTMRLAAEGQGERSFDTKRSQKSPAWTTRLAEIPVAR